MDVEYFVIGIVEVDVVVVMEIDCGIDGEIVGVDVYDFVNWFVDKIGWVEGVDVVLVVVGEIIGIVVVVGFVWLWGEGIGSLVGGSVVEFWVIFDDVVN